MNAEMGFPGIPRFANPSALAAICRTQNKDCVAIAARPSPTGNGPARRFGKRGQENERQENRFSACVCRSGDANQTAIFLSSIFLSRTLCFTKLRFRPVKSSATKEIASTYPRVACKFVVPPSGGPPQRRTTNRLFTATLALVPLWGVGQFVRDATWLSGLCFYIPVAIAQ